MRQVFTITSQNHGCLRVVRSQHGKFVFERWKVEREAGSCHPNLQTDCTFLYITTRNHTRKDLELFFAIT